MKKILVVEDELNLFRVLQWRLEASGKYTVIRGRDGVDGLEKVKSEKPDLIILDVMMPTFNGFEVCKILKSDELTKNIPVIMLTSMSTIGNMEEGLRSGADDYMTKPADPSLLLKKIEKFLKENV